MKLKLSSKLIIQILFFCTVVILASNLINGFFIRSKEAEKNQNVSKALIEFSQYMGYEALETNFNNTFLFVEQIQEMMTSQINSKILLFKLMEQIADTDTPAHGIFVSYNNRLVSLKPYFYNDSHNLIKGTLDPITEKELMALSAGQNDYVVYSLPDKNGKPHQHGIFIFPVFENDSQTGLIGIVYDTGYLSQMLGSLFNMSDIQGVIINSRGQIIANTNDYHNSNDYSEVFFEEARMQAENETGEYFIWNDLLMMSKSIQFIDNSAPWHFIVSIPAEYILSGSETLQLVNLIIILGGGLLLAFFIRKTVKRNLAPIKNIVDVMEKAKQGDLSSRTSVHSSDEIEMIGTELNSLLDSLQQNKKELLTEIENNKELNEELESLIQQNDRVYFDTIKSLNIALETKDKYTAGHCDRVTDYSMMIANAIGFNEKQKSALLYGTVIHDIGKIGIPGKILNKNGRLSEEEYLLIQSHPEKGYHILKDVYFLEDTICVVYQHHERYDGKGYPRGLKGTQISLLARIAAIADTFDAMTSDRAYRKALSKEVALKELINNKGTQFDPNLVDVFISEYQKDQRV